MSHSRPSGVRPYFDHLPPQYWQMSVRPGIIRSPPSSRSGIAHRRSLVLKRAPRLPAAAAQFLLGIAGLALITFVCFRLGFGVSRTSFAYLILILLVSLLGSFTASIVLSIVAIACLNYFFVPPLFEFRVDDPDDIVRLALFFATSLIVTALTTRVRASEARFRTFVDHATDAFFLLDEHSTVLDVNRQACDSLGHSREELIGKHRSDFDVGLDDASIESLRRRMVGGEAITFETRHRRNDGTSFPVEIRVSQFDQGGRRFLGLARDITERKRAEDEVRASEARFRTFVDHATDGFFLFDEHQALLDVNRQACESLGYSREEMIGMHPSDFDAALDEASIARIGERIKAGETVTFETIHRRKDGTLFPVEVRARQFPLGVRPFRLSLARDITERKRAEDALRRSESYLAEAQRLSHTGTIVFSETGPVYWSEESYRIWGLDPLHGLPDLETVLHRIHPDDRHRVRNEAFEALRQNRTYVIELRIVLPDGTVKYLETTGHPFLSADGEREMVATHVDVTERKRAQGEHERLRQLESDLAHLNRLSIMGELAASLAHEILHPIATARNNARAGMRFLEMSPPNLDEVREALACVVRDADRAKDIVGRMRDHIQKAPPRSDAFDLNEAIHEVIAMVRSAIDKNRVSIRTRLMEGMISVRGDRVQLQQVVLNLILNAVEAMSSVKEGVRELSISAKQGQMSDILVAVQDSGPGIDPEHVERVFAPFYTTKTSGIGMGLAICRSIIAAHGGRLWVEVNPPRGAIFQFTLPAGLEDS
jgi:PAS domain S-box-containing protein